MTWVKNMIIIKIIDKGYVGSIGRSWRLCWGLESVLIFYDYITSHQKLNCIKQHTCIVS